jgi:hypothetical protein
VPFKLWLKLAVADYQNVSWFLQPGGGIEQAPKTPALGEFTDGADNVSTEGEPESFSPGQSFSWLEPVVERYRQGDRGLARLRSPEVAFEDRVGADCSDQAPVEVTVIWIASDVTRVAKCADQGGSTMGSGSNAQEVVVGEVTDDYVTVSGQPGDRPQIRSKIERASLLDKNGIGPGILLKSPFEVATANKEELGVYAMAVKCSTVEIGYGTRAGPLVGKDDHADPHR